MCWECACGMQCCWGMECTVAANGMQSDIPCCRAAQKLSFPVFEQTKSRRKENLTHANAKNADHAKVRHQSEKDELCRNELVQQFLNSGARLSPMTATHQSNRQSLPSLSHQLHHCCHDLILCTTHPSLTQHYLNTSISHTSMSQVNAIINSINTNKSIQRSTALLEIQQEFIECSAIPLSTRRSHR